MSEKLLVTGASGHMGRRVLELLLESGVTNIYAATRTPEKLADFAARGVTVRQGDFDDAASLAQAFAGIDRVLLISTDVLGVPGRRLTQHETAVKAAEDAGVKHVVYTSILNPGPEAIAAVAPDHRGTETALANSSLGWTSLRNSIYGDLQVGAMNQAVQMGHIYSAAGDGRTSYILREDCSRAAAAALAAPFEGRRALDITGPEALSQADLAAIVSNISGKTITYVPLTLDMLIDNMVAAGLPRPVAELYSSFDAAIAKGQLDTVSNDFETLTGRKATRMADFLAQHKAALLGTAGV